MIYKVFYQEQADEAPVREETKTMFVEANNVREVREKLADKEINIEHILELSEGHLEYEQKSDNFKLEKL